MLLASHCNYGTIPNRIIVSVPAVHLMTLLMRVASLKKLVSLIISLIWKKNLRKRWSTILFRNTCKRAHPFLVRCATKN